MISETGLFDSLQIACEFMAQSDQLTNNDQYDAAQAALSKARSYAFNNSALLDDIQQRSDTLDKARWQYVKRLETEAADLFNQAQFNGKQARQVLQTLLDHAAEFLSSFDQVAYRNLYEHLLEVGNGQLKEDD